MPTVSRWLIAHRLLFIVVMLTLIVVVIDISYEFRHRSYSGHPGFLPGDVVPDLVEARFLDGSASLLARNGPTFIFYLRGIDPTTLQIVTYADSLWAHKKDSQPFGVTLVSGGHFKPLEDLIREHELHVPLVIDADNHIARALHIPSSDTAFIAIDSTRRVLFDPSGGLIRSEDFREAYELYTTGRVQYQPLDIDIATKVGQPFLDIPVRDVISGARTTTHDLQSKGEHEFAIFAAECPVCALQGTLPNISINPNVIPLFSSTFSLGLLRNSLQDNKIRQHAYIAEGELTGFESLYYADTSYGNSGVLVSVNSRNLITSITPILAR